MASPRAWTLTAITDHDKTITIRQDPTDPDIPAVSEAAFIETTLRVLATQRAQLGDVLVCVVQPLERATTH